MGMAVDDLIDDAVKDVADGRAVDWQAIAPRVRSDAERERLNCLRVVAAIADVHRSSLGADAAPPPEAATTQSDDSADQAGDAWGRYRLIEQVGAGSFGSVYRAWDPQLEREVAIKILHRQVTDEMLRERILLEGRALAKVRHPNVVSVFGVESHGDRVGLCMEFVHGETLESRLSAIGTFGAREALLVGQDLCRALAAVHHAGFVHRDIKARNIMRERGTGRTVLMDFGTGRQLDRAIRAGRPELAGTPMYMAPEVLAGQAASACSDVYSVGVLLYHVVTGEYPVDGRTIDDLRAAHMLGRRTPIAERAPDLPVRFMHAVEHALAANPEQRCPSTGALLEELVAADTGPRTLGWAKRVVNWTLGGVGLLAALTLLGIVNTRYFNAILGRSDYANEGVRDWLYWGTVSSVAPAVLFTVALLAFALLAALKRALVGSWKLAGRIEFAVVAGARRLHLDELPVLSSLVLLVSASILIATWLYFSALLGGLLNLFPDVSTTASENLAFLSPAFTPYHQTYRASFIWVTIACAFLWYPVLRRAHQSGEPLNRGVIAGGIAVTVLSALLLDFPYRLLVHSEFEAARWRENSCYIIGERADQFLLFCPDLPPPRNRAVAKADRQLERAGGKQNIFSGLLTHP
jgi:serine/threonine-protein kinase